MSAVLVLVWGAGHEGYALVADPVDEFVGGSSPSCARPRSSLLTVRSLIAVLKFLWPEGNVGYALSTALADVLVEGAELPGPSSPRDWLYTQLWWWSTPPDLRQYSQQVSPKSVGLRQFGHS